MFIAHYLTVLNDTLQLQRAAFPNHHQYIDNVLLCLQTHQPVVAFRVLHV